MAKTFTAIVLLAGLLALGACQQAATTSNLPSPNFGAPVIMSPAQPLIPARTAPVVVMPPPRTTPVPQHVAVGSVPANWVPSVPARQWKWIVIHHSDTTSGSAAAFDAAHKAKGWDELGYDMVIGNGSETGDGAVEIGPRWIKQKWGAHTKTPDNRFNEYGIGICLVGNFQVQHPTQAQMRSLTKLVAYLCKTYHIPVTNIVGHKDCKSTDCPGRNMSVADVRRLVSQVAGVESGPAQHASAGELMYSHK